MRQYESEKSPIRDRRDARQRATLLWHRHLAKRFNESIRDVISRRPRYRTLRRVLLLSLRYPLHQVRLRSLLVRSIFIINGIRWGKNVNKIWPLVFTSTTPCVLIKSVDKELHSDDAVDLNGGSGILHRISSFFNKLFGLFELNLRFIVKCLLGYIYFSTVMMPFFS